MALTLIQFLKSGSANSKQIQLATGLSQAAVSRHISKYDDLIITTDKQRPPVYSLTRNAFGAGNSLPITMVDLQGKNIIVGYLRPLEPIGFYLESNDHTAKVLLGSNNGFFADLPYFLDDLRPQGFLGKQIARHMVELSDDFSANLQYWSANQIGRYLIANGDDLSGNIKIGEQAYLRLLRKPKLIDHDNYAKIADEVLLGDIVGSSAAGEQPKFTLFSKRLQQHVIVKFSPKGDDEAAQRWRDVLISEHYASEALNKYGVRATKTQLLEENDRLFLESVRFDRKGMFGRGPMLSLFAIDMEFVGSASNWFKTCSELLRQNLFSSEDLQTVKVLTAFGKLINNTDMHLGNMSLSIEGDRFCLLPIYDMCCMGFAPKFAEVMPFKFSPPVIDNIELSSAQLTLVKKAVNYFWCELAQDKRISVSFRNFIMSH